MYVLKKREAVHQSLVQTCIIKLIFREHEVCWGSCLRTLRCLGIWYDVGPFNCMCSPVCLDVRHFVDISRILCLDESESNVIEARSSSRRSLRFQSRKTLKRYLSCNCFLKWILYHLGFISSLIWLNFLLLRILCSPNLTEISSVGIRGILCGNLLWSQWLHKIYINLVPPQREGIIWNIDFRFWMWL